MNSSISPPRTLVAGYRLFLFAYPRAFRRKHAADMEQLFRDRYRALRVDGGRPFGRFLVAAFVDPLIEGPAERFAWIRRRSTRPVGRRAIGGPGSPNPPGGLRSVLESVGQDLRYALRSLRRSPGLVAASVASLGLGVGAATTVFSGLDVFMLRPLPLPEPDRLYAVYTTNADRGWTEINLSIPDYLDYRSEVRSLEIAAYYGQGYGFAGGERPERVQGQRISANFFDVLGIAPARGREFSIEEELAGGDRVAIVSDGFWQRLLGGDAAALGRTILLDAEPYTVVGIMPSDFWFGRQIADVWTPLGRRGDESRQSHFLNSIARLRPDVSESTAGDEVAQVATRTAEANPEASTGNGARIAPYRWEVFDEGFRQGSLIAGIGVALVLLIACANVANLFLTRAAGRNREMGVRAALGAGRGRLIRQLLTEALVVGILGGALGLGFSVWGIKGLVSIIPADFPRVDQIGIDPRVLTFTAAVSMLTGLLFGLAPALNGSRLQLTDSLKEGGRTGTAGRGPRTRRALVVAEVSLAFVLLVSSALLVQAFLRLQGEDLGFDREHLLTFRLTLSEREYPDSTAIVELHRTLLAEFGSLPGVSAASGVSNLPTRGDSRTYYSIPGEDLPDDTRRPVINYRYVFPDYFRTLGVPLLEGRDVVEADGFGQPPVVVINEAMATRHWPGRSALGQQVTLSSGAREIIGVVPNARLSDPDDQPEPMIFLPALQRGLPSMSFALRATGSAAALTSAVTESVRRADPRLPLYDVAEMGELISTRLREDAIMAKIMGTMAIVALILSLVGVYGVMAHTVAQRAPEVGIRMALGASARDVVRLMVGHGVRLAAVGIGTGLLLTLGVTRSLSFFLYGVSPFHAATFGLTTAALLIACLAATYVPARRATRVDPVTSLRTE